MRTLLAGVLAVTTVTTVGICRVWTCGKQLAGLLCGGGGVLVAVVETWLTL